MTVLATLVFTTFSSYLVNPQWFDHGSYSQYSTHSTLEECQLAKYGTDAICVGDSPFQWWYTLYVNDEAEDVPEDFSQPMKFIECDYWAGCYSHRPVTRTVLND
jgi:hypothetical protein